MEPVPLMRPWEHAQDVADAIGARRQPPAGEFRVELTGPAGDLRAWEPEDASDGVPARAKHLCLLVTRRRHREARRHRAGSGPQEAPP